MGNVYKLELRANGVFMNMEAKMETLNNAQVWFRIAEGLQELSDLLDTAESVETEVWRMRHRYKQRLLGLKEQAIRNSLLN